jgi:hypothetical protein
MRGPAHAGYDLIGNVDLTEEQREKGRRFT